jgi:hypothetical protein
MEQSVLDKVYNKLSKAGLLRQESDGHTRFLPGAMQRIGGAVGGRFGMAEAGRALGNSIARVTGQGDYEVRGNSLLDMGHTPALHFDTKFGGKRIMHREQFYTLAATDKFKSRRFSINPGNLNMFPSLARISQEYTSYKIHGMIFEFVSTSGPVATNTPASGVVVMATQYNTARLPFERKVEANGAKFTTSGKPYESFTHPIECDPEATGHDTSLLIRMGGIGDSDAPFYDWGNVSIITEGMDISSGGYNVGEIWVTYDVTLYEQRVTPLLYNNFGSSVSTYSTSATPFAEIVSGLHPYHADWLGLEDGTTGAAKLIFRRQGVYVLTTHCVGSSLTLISSSPSSGMTVSSAGSLDASATTFTAVFTISVAADSIDGESLTISWGGTPTQWFWYGAQQWGKWQYGAQPQITY